MVNEHLESIQGGEKGRPRNLLRKRKPGREKGNLLKRYSAEGNVARPDPLIEIKEAQKLIARGIISEVFERFEEVISFDEADAIDMAVIAAAVGQIGKIEELKKKFPDMPGWAKWLDGKVEEYKGQEL